MSNFVDITSNTIFSHVKEVEANCKKALALCMGEKSPYRNFNRTFPSGTNYEDYLLWIQREMYSVANTVPIEDVIDEDVINLADDEEVDDNGGNSDDDDGMGMPGEQYFKRFFAFALFGYIPPSGGEKYKSSLMLTVVDTTEKTIRRTVV